MRSIDLNADVGEGAASDAELIPLVTSVNIACGGHAGDEQTMLAAVHAAVEAGVAIGAHPGHPDRESFGRRELPITPAEAHALLVEQIGHLASVTARCGGAIRYVKLHGGLYHQAGRDAALAESIVAAVRMIDPALALLGQAGAALDAAAAAAGVAFYAEAFADRAYHPGGGLAPRSIEGAVLSDAQAVARQAVRIVLHGGAPTLAGGVTPLRCDSLCLHGDSAGVVRCAGAVRVALIAEQIELRAFATRSSA